MMASQLCRALVLTVFGGMLLLTASCGQTTYVTGSLDEIKDIPPPWEGAGYTLNYGDEIELRFTYASELNDRLTIRPDGRITLPFTGAVLAVGLTPEELAHRIEKRLRTTVRHPEVIVVMRSMPNHRVFVGGEVTKAGFVTLYGDETILTVLNQAGWVTPFAGNDRIALMRRDQDGRLHRYNVDVDALTSGADLSQDVRVVAGDIIMVPPSNATSANRWIDQNIRQMIPFITSAGATYSLNRPFSP